MEFRMEWGNPERLEFIDVQSYGGIISMALGVDDYELWGEVDLTLEQAITLRNALDEAIQGVGNGS